MVDTVRTLSTVFVVSMIRIYRASLGRLIPTCCAYYPSCSQYAEDAVRAHGIMRGAHLSMKRLLRCHPFNRGGFDPVP